MKPKTKEQKRIVALSEKLRPVTDKQLQWGWDNCLSNYFARSRKTLYCLECGHSWKDGAELVSQLAGCDCPECGRELKYSENAYHNNSAYYGILTTKDDMQVFRIIWVEKQYKKGTPTYYMAHEVMQHWIDQSGKVTTMSKSVNGLSRYFDQWIFQSELEVRPKQFDSCPRYSIQPYKIYPDRRIMQVLKRNGFSGHFYGIIPQNLFSKLLSDPKAELLVKNNQIDLLQTYFKAYNNVEKHWQSIKICIRNKYIVKDASTWLDYIDLLEYFQKDLRSAHYVCPTDLKKAHDRLVKKKREIQRSEKIELMREKVEASQLEYQEQKKKFFGLAFSDEEITVRVLEHVSEFMEEGDELGHCVFTNEYYGKQNSLIMSARIENKPVETVEISLSDLKIIQSRGAGNCMTKYHKKIVNLVNNNMPTIGKLIHATV